jgi:putative membrane protein
VAGLAAVGAAQPLFAVALLWLTGQARSGLAMGIQGGASIQAWSGGRAPRLLLAVLAAWVAASLAGAATARLLDAPASRWLPRLPQRPLSAMALGILVLLAILLAGPIGLCLFAAGTVTGLVPLAAGVRRVHLTGALVLPALLAR